MKKILFLVKEYGFGGIEKQAITLANSLVDLYTVEILFLNVPNPQDTVSIHKKIAVHTLLDKKTTTLFMMQKLKSFFKENHYDIILTTDAIFNKVINHLPNETKKIFWCHQEYQDGFLKNLTSFSYIVFPTSENAEYEIPFDVKIIPNAIDIEVNKLASLNHSTLVSVGKLTKRKGMDELIDVLHLVHMKNEDVHLKIIGDGEELQNLKKKVMEYGLEKNVHFLGFLGKKELLDELLTSDLFLLASHRETFGLSIIEAMSVGLPCITYDSSKHIEEMIQNDINGYVVQNRDKEKMANKVLEYLENKFALQNMGSCAKESSLIYDIHSLKSEWLKIL